MKAKYEYWLCGEGLEKIRGLAAAGLDKAAIAGQIGVCRTTFSKWCRRFSPLAELFCGGRAVADSGGRLAYKSGGEKIAEKVGEPLESRSAGSRSADRLVEAALLRRAAGYIVQEITRQPSKETGELEITKVVEKEVMPSTTAQIFWLKNRCGWDADGIQPEDEGEGGVVLLPPVDGE